jgi:hypothetical protein
MPLSNVNDRMAFAELAAEHGWDTTVEHINDKTTMVAVTYRRADGEQILVRFNYLDKMTEAVNTLNGVSSFLMRPATVKMELSRSRPQNQDEGPQILTARDEVKAFRDEEETGYAYAWTDGTNQRFWRVFAPLDVERAKVGPGPDEPAMRRAVLILLKEFA